MTDPPPDWSDELHAVAVKAWHDLSLEIRLVLNDSGYPKRDPRLFATSIAATTPLSGWIRPKNAK